MDFRPWADLISRWAAVRGRDVVLLNSVRSTNRLGLEIISQSAPADSGAWIFALHQQQGSGRFGRSWVSPHGAGVYASLLLRLTSDSLPTLPLVVGVGLCEGLAAAGFVCRLKWPNDLQLNGKKVGGILLQSRSSRDHASVVIGFGINHRHRAEDLPRSDCTSLELSKGSRLPPLASLATSLAEAVENELDRYRHRRSWDSPSVVERYRSWSAHRLGDRLEMVVGDDLRVGQFAGFSPQGHLRLQMPSGERLLVAGEIGGD